MIVYYDNEGRVRHWRTSEGEPDTTLNRIEADVKEPYLYYVKDGELREYPPQPGHDWEFDHDAEEWIHNFDLEAEQRKLIGEINTAIGKMRQAHITALPGQEMIYTAKEAEAKAYLAEDPEPEDLDDYPFLAAEVGVTAETPYQLAQIWLYMASEWRTVGPQLENLRLALIGDAEAATTPEEVDQVRVAVEAVVSD
ncbi:MAG: hypothetical protein HLUCCO07_11975 [Rhodobacteraceae bacterium HLUCCO07]|nr:MAG: hypothetical protein HLUCCO07_11975 [Rhodobacteraceae bacterium HLUCCO07]